ncbi:MAG: hypothetical protein NTY23_11630 [Chloroflexi bacterium]|nr:hypothetical protein [Chloroflexota bacterium]
MKIAVIGSGSTYTPGLVLRWLETKRDRIPIQEICLYDLDPQRLALVGNFVQAMVEHEAPGVRTVQTTDLEAAIRGAHFVVLQIRVGLNRQRRIDEHLCVEHGFLGQETTGPAGFLLALRQIPPSLEIARAVQRLAPEAWLISVANPAGILAEALIRHGHDRTIGMCHGGFFPRTRIARLLGVEESRVAFDYVGLNHLGWATRIWLDGRLVPPERMRQMAAALFETWNRTELSLPTEFAEDFCPPLAISYYHAHYFMHDESVAEARRLGKTRADAVLQLEQACLDYYRTQVGRQFVPPPELGQRGGTLEEKRKGTYGWRRCSAIPSVTSATLPPARCWTTYWRPTASSCRSSLWARPDGCIHP